MLIDKVKKVTVRKCKNGHAVWFSISNKYCITCGSKILQIKEDMFIKVCDHCEKEVETIQAISPVLHCPHCGEITGKA